MWLLPSKNQPNTFVSGSLIFERTQDLQIYEGGPSVIADSSVPASLDDPLRFFFDVFDGRRDLASPEADDAELGAGATGTPVWIFSAAASPASTDAISSC